MSIYDDHKPVAGGGLYLKIADGETVKIRIASEPAIFDSVFEGSDGQSISTRYAWLVWNQTEQTVQVMQQSATFFRNIAALAQNEEWGDPTGYDINISRTGTGTDSKYTVMPSPNRNPLPSDATAALQSINLIEKIEASPSSQRVYWLKDFEGGTSTVSPKASEKPVTQKTVMQATDPKTTASPQDLGDEPINLDDIPF